MVEVLEKSNIKKSIFFIFVIVIIIILLIAGFFFFIRFNNVSSDKLNYNIDTSCYYTNKCPENTNCFYVDRYNYKTHQRELIYSECLKICQEEDDNTCPEGSKCGLFPIKDVNPSDNLNRTIEHLCFNEQKINESIKKAIIDNGITGKINRKQFNFNGDINDTQTKEYNFTTTEKTLEVEMVLSYYGGCMDLHIFDSIGRHTGENWGPPGSVDKPTIPEAEYHREPCSQTVIKLKSPLPDSYKVKVFASEIYGGGKGNFDVLVEEVYEI